MSEFCRKYPITYKYFYKVLTHENVLEKRYNRWISNSNSAGFYRDPKCTYAISDSSVAKKHKGTWEQGTHKYNEIELLRIFKKYQLENE